MKAEVSKEYFNVQGLSVYSGISERTLWDLLKDPVNPIPHFRVGASGRIVRIRRSEFDNWMEGYRAESSEDIDSLVNDLLK